MFGLFVCSSLLEVSVVGLFVLRRHSDRSEEPPHFALAVGCFFFSYRSVQPVDDDGTNAGNFNRKK
jgi:hypothetical protein